MGNPLESSSLVIWGHMATGLWSAETEGPQALGYTDYFLTLVFKPILTWNSMSFTLAFSLISFT